MNEFPCPTCHRPVILVSSSDRPFCSERCRLIDLGAWASEEYKVPGGSSYMMSADTDELYEE